LPEDLSDPNSLKLAISEGSIDNDFPLVYDFDGKYYTMEPGKLVPKQGESYVLRGLANNKGGETDVRIVMPIAPAVDSVMAKRILDPFGTDKQVIEVSIQLSYIKYKESFFCVEPKLTKGTAYSFIDDVQAYKSLKHKNGFVVDAARIKDNTIKFLIDDVEDLKSINLEISSLTSVGYKYVSDNVTDVSTSNPRPAISGDAFNITTSKAYGSFSGSSSITKAATVK
jgi:hypothetical protein